MDEETKWYDNRANLADTAEWMFDHDWPQDEVMEMLRRPWKYADQWIESRAYRAGTFAAHEDAEELARITTV